MTRAHLYDLPSEAKYRKRTRLLILLGGAGAAWGGVVALLWSVL